MYAASPVTTGVSKTVHSAVVRSGLQAPVYPGLDVQTCGILRHPLVLSRGTFVELWIFYSLQY